MVKRNAVLVILSAWIFAAFACVFSPPAHSGPVPSLNSVSGPFTLSSADGLSVVTLTAVGGTAAPTLNVSGTGASFTINGVASSTLMVTQNTSDSIAITATGAQTFNITATPAVADTLNVTGSHGVLEASGIYSSGASPGTNTLSLKIAGVALASDDTLTLPALQTNSPWRCRIVWTTQVTGTSGKIVGCVETSYGASSVVAVTTVGATVGQSSAANLTGTPNVLLQTNFSAAGNTIKVQDLRVEVR